MAKDKDNLNLEDTSAYGDETRPHILDDANGAVDPFKPGELDKGTSGLADNPDHGKSLSQIVEESKQRLENKNKQQGTK
ncbi:hypothetical protein [Bacillus sp. FJAT-27251]|uniref:hypothetical protein n=1 Tax=Bacillus sp. FJAT-27251 TaxID=1684142 RepID=UPI0006A7BC2C|nr:hypothetical protein [Bacillus sp. FJAT-27251]